jgi:hypothetical protein
MLHDQKAEVVLLQDGHELVGGVGAAHIQLGDVSVQLSEDAGVVAPDREDLVALQFQVASPGLWPASTRGRPIH